MSSQQHCMLVGLLLAVVLLMVVLVVTRQFSPFSPWTCFNQYRHPVIPQVTLLFTSPLPCISVIVNGYLFFRNLTNWIHSAIQPLVSTLLVGNPTTEIVYPAILAAITLAGVIKWLDRITQPRPPGQYVPRKHSSLHFNRRWEQVRLLRRLSTWRNWINDNIVTARACSNSTTIATTYQMDDELVRRAVHGARFHSQQRNCHDRKKSYSWQYAMTRATATTIAKLATCTHQLQFQALHTVIALHTTSPSRPSSDYKFDTDSYLIAIDNCCSRCITNSLDDFVSTPTKVGIAVRGIGGDAQATYVGTVQWSIEDDQGRTTSVIIPNTYYNRESPYRLLSPQHWAAENNDNDGTWCATFHNRILLHWNGGTRTRTIPLDERSNIGLMRSTEGFSTLASFCNEIASVMSPIDERNLMAFAVVAQPQSDDESLDSSVVTFESTADVYTNDRRHPDLPDDVFTADRHRDITAPTDAMEIEDLPQQHIIPEDPELQHATPQAELLSWHYRLGHMPFERIMYMAARGDLPAHLAKVKPPRCAACLFGKATRRPWRSRSPINKEGAPTLTTPGAVVSVDQLVSATPGLIGQMRGFLTHKRYKVATIFVDNHSGFSYVFAQQSTSAEETVKGKLAFERYAKAHGVKILHYHADNGIFAEREFVHAVHAAGQTISFAAVNAHHQNGRAEKKIRDLQDIARAMMLHAKQRWPAAIATSLWPYAIRMANEMANYTPTKTCKSSAPIEIFSQVDIAPRVKHTHTFGSPVYVLDSQAQSGQKLPKWQNRARVGVYLGTSPRHSRKIALVLSLATGHVSPQFHCKFDDLFETLRPSAGNPPFQSRWQAKAGFVEPDDESKAPPRREFQNGGKDGNHDDEMIMHGQDAAIDRNEWSTDDNNEPIPLDGSQQPPIGASDLGGNTDLDLQPSDPLYDTVTVSGRRRIPTQRLVESNEQRLERIVAYAHIPWEVFHDDAYIIQDHMEDPIAFLASNNPDILYLDEAMRADDSHHFEQAMLEEVNSHTDNDHWEVVPRSSVPAGTKVLAAVWAFRRKRRILTKQVYKWKARLNIHGGQQQHGVNFWETYAPVVGWTTIRLFLIVMLLNKHKSKQVDFVLAFPQADIECPMYMDLPQGFKFKGDRKTHCLRLRKNLYGQKQAGRVWNQYMHDGLLARGFTQSGVDMCVYYRGNVTLLIYTDDGIFIGPTSEEIQECFDVCVVPVTSEAGTKHRVFKMTDEGELSDYLGVNIERLPNGLIKLYQPQIIDQILEDLGFNDRTAPKGTPAVPSVKLGRDIGGQPHSESWHYRSIIGKLNFLEKSTRPDLAYSVHQCARFSNDPKESHSAAVKRIGKYLIGTRDKGIILNPKGHSFDTFVDADFVGNWDRVNADVDPSTAKSRTGFIVMYGGCPVHWASKLQREVALSTTEAEYNALSEALRSVISQMSLIEEIRDRLQWDINCTIPRVHCKVFEDNSGALEMSRLPKMRPHTKHINIRMHHFREHVREGKISIHKIPTDYQLADIATKGQPQPLYESQRESITLWKDEHKSIDELSVQAEHLRACEIIEQAPQLVQQACSLNTDSGKHALPCLICLYLGDTVST